MVRLRVIVKLSIIRRPGPLGAVASWGGGHFDAVLCRKVDRDSAVLVFTTRLQHKQKN